MSETGIEILKIVLSAVGGGGLTFVAMLLKRKWEKDDRKDEIMEELKKTNGEIKKTNEKLDSLKTSFMHELEKDRKEAEEYRAKQSRARILSFNDELVRCTKHTKESFEDVIAEIDYYEDYCSSHPKFPNFKAVAAIENIKVVYKKRLQENDFLA